MNFEKQAKELREIGFSVIENFITDSEVLQLKEECSRLLEEADLSENRTVFTSGDKQSGNEYFLNSADKISFFFEEKAFDKNGVLLVDDKKALNKIGHALHWWNKTFKKLTFSNKIQAISRALGLVDPVVVQSMYIFKHPLIGGEVVAHQDASYLYTEPNHLVGFWLALEDTDVTNGCLWFIPRSHKGNVTKRMIRSCQSPGQLIVQTYHNTSFSDEEFVPVQVKKGSLIILDGKVVHRSGVNHTDTSREVYTFHVVDLHNTKYSEQNWLQPTEALPFPSLYKTKI